MQSARRLELVVKLEELDADALLAKNFPLRALACWD